MPDDALKALELKIDELILLCNQLNTENQTLKRKSSDWQQERTNLMEKFSSASERVNTLLEKLRNAESSL
ncbi:MAG: DUF904 domain-containing protein [Halieaceae bacterium]|nr:DUF904 domain-containing protein [Halieaceae bacterium]